MAYGQRDVPKSAESETERTGYFAIQDTASATAVARTRELQSAPSYVEPAPAQPYVPQGGKRGGGRAFLRGLSLFMLGLVIGAAMLFAAQWFSLFEPFRAGDQQPNKAARRIIVEKTDGSGFKTINSALDAAERGGAEGGLMIEVGPGEYHEHISLRNGLSLVSRVPGGAVIYAPDHGEYAGFGVSADGVESATLAGFKITGNEAHPLSVGLRLTNSSVEVSDTEISNAERACVEIAGSDRSTIRASYIHSYRDAGVVISGEAAPRLIRNVIRRDDQPQNSGRPAIQVGEGAKPRFQWNTIHESEYVQGLEAESKEEFRRNNFVISKAKDVREPQANDPLRQDQPRSRW
jgi:Right handed beta helix region